MQNQQIVNKATAPTTGLNYTQRLLKALKGYLDDPAELTMAKSRLKPALHIGPGEPQLSTNLLVGTTEQGHKPLYQLADAMPGAKQIHGYYDPTPDVFFDDALNKLLYDPAALKSAVKSLEGGMTAAQLSELLSGMPSGL